MRLLEDGSARKGAERAIGTVGAIVLISITILVIAAFASGFFQEMLPEAIDKTLGPFLERIEAIS